MARSTAVPAPPPPMPLVAAVAMAGSDTVWAAIVDSSKSAGGSG